MGRHNIDTRSLQTISGNKASTNSGPPTWGARPFPGDTCWRVRAAMWWSCSTGTKVTISGTSSGPNRGLQGSLAVHSSATGHDRKAGRLKDRLACMVLARWMMYSSFCFSPSINERPGVLCLPSPPPFPNPRWIALHGLNGSGVSCRRRDKPPRSQSLCEGENRARKVDRETHKGGGHIRVR